MKNFARFLIPLGLGLVSFILVWVAVQPQLGHDFVIVNASVPVGQPFSESDLARFKVVGDDFKRLSLTLVPWEERAAVIGLPAKQALEKGDLVFWQEVQYTSRDFLLDKDEIPLHLSFEGVDYEPSLLKVGNQIGLIVPIANPDGRADTHDSTATLGSKFEELGPFRVLSVGQRTLGAPADAATDAQHGDGHLVTLAVKTETNGGAGRATGRPFPEAARKLLAAKALRRPDGKNIVAMVLYQNDFSQGDPSGGHAGLKGQAGGVTTTVSSEP